MQPETFPFYPFSPEDSLIKQAKKEGLINLETRVTPDLKERCSQYPFKLNSECRSAISCIVSETFEVKDRLPLYVKTSMQEISLKVRKVAKEKFDVDLKTLFIGGGVVKALNPLFLDFFETCGINHLLTVLFKAKINVKPNDYDFQFIADLDKAQDYKELVDEGIVSLLASKIKWEYINPLFLVSQLNNSKKYSEKLSKDAYLKKVFEEHPKFNSKSKDLGKLAIKTFGFAKANDSAGYFYFRNIESEENSYDCFIPVGDFRKINSFCIDISQIEKMDSDLYLDSLLGKEMLVQAIIDANFAILYSDPNQSANELDFGRTICHLSKKGRLAGVGWLAKAYLAFDEAREKRSCMLSDMLPGQLISRADNHHRSPQQALIVMAFNASAILMTMNPHLEDEIQKLWQEVGKHLLKFGKKRPHDPLIEMIKVLMCDSGCSFQDLFAQIQVSAFLKQHECHEGKGTYKCRPSQSEEILFTQVLINFSDEEYSVDYGTLFFPYAVSDSIAHITNLKPLHDLLIAGSTIAVGIDKSVLKKEKYRLDSRRKFFETEERAFNLLKTKDEHAWRMGFLLTLSHLAMSDDDQLFKALIQNLVSMLINRWPTKEFKSEIAVLMHQMLKNSGISVRDTFFQNAKRNSIIGDLLTSDKKCLKDLGWSYFKKIENKPHDVLEKLYFDLVHSSFECYFLKELLAHMASSNQFSVHSCLKVYAIIFIKLDHLPGIEEELLEAVLISIQRIKVSKEGVSAFVQIALESKACKLFPHLGLCLAWEAHRLKIFCDAVEIIHEMTIQAPEIHPIYFTEKFDALSDFMQHYSFLSVQALRNSIGRHKNEGLVHLLKLLAKSKFAWDERVLFLEMLENQSVIEAEEVLELFFKSWSKRTNKEQVQFYLGQLQNARFLEPLLALMGSEVTDEEFSVCTENIIRIKELTLSHRKIISERFVQQLYNRKRWSELKDIYFAEPQILLEWTVPLVSIFINSYYHLGESEQLLKTVPLDMKLSQELNETLILLLRESQNKALKREDFVETLQWAKKCKSIEDSETFLNHWCDELPELLYQYKEQKEGLYELVHQVFCWTNPNPILWKTYILLALNHAPLNVIEKILELLPDKEFIEPILERLEDLGSKKFLDLGTWWPEVWKKVENETEFIKSQLVYRLIRGASNAYEGPNDAGIKDVLKLLESDDVVSFVSYEEKMFTCPTRVEFARLLWYSEMAEHRSKALSTLHETFFLVGDDPYVEKHAIYLFNAILNTTHVYKSRDDIHKALLLIQRVHESGSVGYASHVGILRFLKKISIKSDAKNKNQEEKEFYKKISACLLYYIHKNVKGVLSRSIEDSKVEVKDKKLVSWGINRVYDSQLLWGYDLSVWCLENPYISLYLNEKEINKLKDYKDSLRGGCAVIVKVLHTWESVKKCNISVIAPFKRYLYLSGHGLKDRFQLQSGERVALEKTFRKTAKFIIKVSLIMAVIGNLALLILKIYNRNKDRDS